MKRIRELFTLIGAVLIFAACGGGGGGDGGGDSGTAPPPPPPPPPVTTYHYYTGVPTVSSAVGGLYSVSSASPAAPVPVNVSALVGEGRIASAIAGTLDLAGGKLNNARTYAVVFATGSGFYKQLADSAPAPVQISNVTTIGTGRGDGTASATTTDLCGLSTMPDIANPENSVVIYRLAGANRSCGNVDDIGAWMRLGATATTAPTALAFTPLGPVFNSSGALAGIVALDSGALVKRDANLANPVTIAAGPYTDVNLLGLLSPTRMLVLIAGTGTSGELRILDASANTLSGVLGTITNRTGWGNFVYDANYFYFVGNDAGGTPAGVIQRFPTDGSAAAALFFDVSAWRSATVAVEGLYLTPGRVVFGGWIGGYLTGDYGAASITKAGLTPLVLAAPVAGEEIAFYGVSDTGFVYYQRWGATSGAARAEAKSDDGVVAMAYGAPNGALWNGLHYSTSWNAFGSTQYLNQLVMAELTAGATTMEGATLSVVSAVNATRSGTAVGTVPTGIGVIVGEGIGTRVLWVGYDASDAEIFYVDTAAAGSLARVTDDGADQYPLDPFD